MAIGTARWKTERRANGAASAGNPSRSLQKPKPRSGRPDVAVTQIRGLLGGELILALEGAQPVLGEGWHPDIVGGLEIDPVHAGRVAAEDQLLDRAIGATERRKTIFLLHILRDFEPAQRLDLPLGRPVPNRVGAPQDMIDPHALDQRADQGRAEFGMRHRRVRKRRAKLGVDVGDSELLRNFRQIGRPPDAARGLELGPGLWRRRRKYGDRSLGGDDTFLSSGQFGKCLAYGDALTMSGRAHGGDDTLKGTDGSGSPFVSVLVGDAQTMSDNAHGGCDTLISGTGNDDMWGDAQVMLGNAKGGNVADMT